MSTGPEQPPPPQQQQQQQAPNLRVLQKGLQNERLRQAGGSPGQPAASPASTSTANPNAESRSALLAWTALPCTRAAACLSCAVLQHSSAPCGSRLLLVLAVFSQLCCSRELLLQGNKPTPCTAASAGAWYVATYMGLPCLQASMPLAAQVVYREEAGVSEGTNEDIAGGSSGQQPSHTPHGSPHTQQPPCQVSCWAAADMIVLEMINDVA